MLCLVLIHHGAEGRELGLPQGTEAGLLPWCGASRPPLWELWWKEVADMLDMLSFSLQEQLSASGLPHSWWE